MLYIYIPLDLLLWYCSMCIYIIHIFKYIGNTMICIDWPLASGRSSPALKIALPRSLTSDGSWWNLTFFCGIINGSKKKKKGYYKQAEMGPGTTRLTHQVLARCVSPFHRGGVLMQETAARVNVWEQKKWVEVWVCNGLSPYCHHKKYELVWWWSKKMAL